MPPRDHQAVPMRHRAGIGDAQRQFVFQQHPAAALQRAEHTARLPSLGGVAAEAEGLQVAEVVRAALVPPLPGKMTPLHPVHVNHQGA